ncbi:uncharacterized protein PG998_000731 [Apiospora kogelbergensis]|uniref:uncharacterized protein n=1 Tax=Apiospora kogelbergensis TaxID=1337665 RepID=UPI00312EBF1A
MRWACFGCWKAGKDTGRVHFDLSTSAPLPAGAPGEEGRSRGKRGALTPNRAKFWIETDCSLQPARRPEVDRRRKEKTARLDGSNINPEAYGPNEWCDLVNGNTEGGAARDRLSYLRRTWTETSAANYGRRGAIHPAMT